MPFDRQLEQMIHGLGCVVVPSPTHPRMLQPWLEDKRMEGGLDVSLEVLSQRRRDCVALSRQAVGCLCECHQVVSIGEGTAVEHLHDQSVMYRLLHPLLVAHVVVDIVTQMLDAQQVGRLAEDVAQSLRPPLLLVGTSHYAGTESDFRAGRCTVE